MLAAALTFAASTLYVPSVALLVLAAGSSAWVGLAAAGATVERRGGPHSVEEEHPWPLALGWSPGLVRPPGGELVEPLLDRPLPVGRSAARPVRVEVRFERRGGVRWRRRGSCFATRSGSRSAS